MNVVELQILDVVELQEECSVVREKYIFMSVTDSND